MTTLLRGRHQKGKAELIQLINEEGSGGVALTTDAWTSSATQSNTTHTAHFLRRDWSVASAVLKTSLFSGSHTAATLAEHSRQVAQEFNILTEVEAVTHDEAANMVATGDLLEENPGWSSHACMAHRLQTVIRLAIDGMRGVKKVLAASRCLVGHFRHSALTTEVLTKKQLELESKVQPKKLIQDVRTRWNSSFCMLQRLIELQRALTIVLVDPVLTPKRDHRDLLLPDEQWTLAKDLVKVLELFEETTTVVSGQKYVTMSLMLPLVTNLTSSADMFAASANSSAARNFAALLKSGLSKKFDLDDIELQSSAVMACALDPRFRNLQILDDTQREEVRRGTIAEIEALQEKADERQKKTEAERKRSEDAAAQKEDRWEPPKKKMKKEAGCKLSRLFASAEKTPISPEESAASRFRSKL